MGSTDAPAIRILSGADIAPAMALSTEAGWNQLPADWALFLRLGEVFGIDEAGELAATAAIIPYGGSFAWIGMVLTRRSARGRGHGTRLLRHCLEALEAQGRTALLDATPEGERIYRQLGFAPLFGLHRWQRDAAGAASPRAGIVEPVPQEAIQLANAAFGADRIVLLQDFIARSPGAARMAENGRASLFARDGRRATQLGPLTASDEGEAIALLDDALQACAGPLFIDLADQASATAQHLERQGFSRQRPFLRMARGSAPWPGSRDSTIAIAGPEFG